ncbi:MAG: hypothetical protein AAGU10_08510 [Methanosarcina mazei]
MGVKVTDNGFSQVCFYLFSALTAPLSPTYLFFKIIKSSNRTPECKILDYDREYLKYL